MKLAVTLPQMFPLPHSWICLQPWAWPQTYHLNPPPTFDFSFPRPHPFLHPFLHAPQSLAALLLLFHLKLVGPTLSPASLSDVIQVVSQCSWRSYMHEMQTVKVCASHGENAALPGWHHACQPTVECKKQCKCGMPLYPVCVRCLPWKSVEFINMIYKYIYIIKTKEAFYNGHIKEMCVSLYGKKTNCTICMKCVFECKYNF